MARSLCSFLSEFRVNLIFVRRDLVPLVIVEEEIEECQKRNYDTDSNAEVHGPSTREHWQKCKRLSCISVGGQFPCNAAISIARQVAAIPPEGDSCSAPSAAALFNHLVCKQKNRFGHR